MAKIDTQFMTKSAEKLWGRTYLYSPYKGVPPGAIWFKVLMKKALMLVQVCVWCDWWFSNKFDLMLETFSSHDTGGCEL